MISVIIPARNEALRIAGCLESLLAQQDEAAFALGRDWELIVVDDGSVDGTAALVQTRLAGLPGTRLMQAPELVLTAAERAFTGKTNACWAGAQAAVGEWLLFTDADTVHEPGSMARALREAERHKVALLSYSPRQEVRGLSQRTLMPLVFAELGSVYPPEQINDPASKIAAANGQFLLVARTAYFAAGGHRAVGRSVLEDVDLAWNVKRFVTRAGATADTAGGIRLRFAPEVLRTHMYSGLADMTEGWTKNLALLFPHALQLAAWRLLDIALLCLPLLCLLPHLLAWQRAAILLLWARTLLRFYRRAARSNFGAANVALSPLGLPLFVFLLVRSWMAYRVFRRVRWKGRDYSSGR